mgnify:CR=1 FL=1
MCLSAWICADNPQIPHGRIQRQKEAEKYLCRFNVGCVWRVGSRWIREVFNACEKAPQHNYLFLTKNPRRYMELHHYGELPLRDNMWYGTTVTDPDTEYMGQDGHYEFHTFLSVEPILADFGELSEKSYIPEWIIVGAETGSRKDKVIPRREWIENIVEQCRKYNIPVFMKPSLTDIWGEELIQEFPKALIHA